MDKVKYVKNPDVVLREEDSDGGLLFNPDTNQIKVLNSTGLFIWKKCDGSRDQAVILQELKESFDGVPEGESTHQVKTFMDELTAQGFLGVLDK